MIKKVVFTYKSLYEKTFNFGNLDKMDVIFEIDSESPVILITSGKVKIEDRSLDIDCNEVLKKISKIDFDKPYDINVPSSFCKNGWELIIDDKKYEGKLEDPYYVSLVKKIIRYTAIEVYAQKKLAGYFKK